MKNLQTICTLLDQLASGGHPELLRGYVMDEMQEEVLALLTAENAKYVLTHTNTMQPAIAIRLAAIIEKAAKLLTQPFNAAAFSRDQLATITGAMPVSFVHPLITLMGGDTVRYVRITPFTGAPYFIGAISNNRGTITHYAILDQYDHVELVAAVSELAVDNYEYGATLAAAINEHPTRVDFNQYGYGVLHYCTAREEWLGDALDIELAASIEQLAAMLQDE